MYYTLFAVGALLFVFTLVMNMISIRLVRRSGRRTDGRASRTTARRCHRLRPLARRDRTAIGAVVFLGVLWAFLAFA